MKRFALGIAAGAVAVFGGLATAYGALATVWPESLPAPAISRLVQIDEKLRFLRRHPEIDPKILAVGSSITWRQIDGDAFEAAGDPPGGFLNGGTGLLKSHQTSDLLDFYLTRFENVGTVLILTGPPDFSDCTREPAALLNHHDAGAYAFENWPEAYFYFRYFAPQRYLRTAMTLAGRRTPYSGDLFLDDYGSGPIEVPKAMQRGLRYGEIDPDPACVESLIRLSHRMLALNVRLIVVFAPIHPDYRQRYPDVVTWLDEAATELETATAEDGTQIIRLADDLQFEGGDFFDAFHLQWPAARRLSKTISSAMTDVPGDIGPTDVAPSPLAKAAGGRPATTTPIQR